VSLPVRSESWRGDRVSANVLSAVALPRFLALGDSYTVGEGVATDLSWPAQLVQRLRARGIAIGAAEIVAKTGWTTDELLLATRATALAPACALVTLLIGVNNQYRGRDLDNYREEFATLLLRAIVFAGGRNERVVVVSIPDWGVTPFAYAQARDAAHVAEAIDAFNATAKAVAIHHKVAFVDVTGLTRSAAAQTGMLVADGLHPSAAQYTRWLSLIEPATASALLS
jgi:lysophospholipase L1-like esterase